MTLNLSYSTLFNLAINHIAEQKNSKFYLPDLFI